MASSEEAKQALYTHIVESLDEVKGVASATARATGIKELALAYRLVTGGTQPGSAVLKN